jgi:hypothetical protein
MMPAIGMGDSMKSANLAKVENGFIVTLCYPKKFEPSAEERKLMEKYAGSCEGPPLGLGELDFGNQMVEETHVAKTWDEAVQILATCMAT